MGGPAANRQAVILIVDDSKLILSMVGKTLRNNGYAVITAGGGLEAITKASAEKPDCIILDLLMPELSGFDVLSVLQTRGFSIPIIVLTADIQETTKKKCLALGAFDFLNKPHGEKDLIATVEKALKNK
jgi:CheY-like chemotaxis protein